MINSHLLFGHDLFSIQECLYRYLELIQFYYILIISIKSYKMNLIFVYINLQ